MKKGLRRKKLCKRKKGKIVKVEYLYLDLNTCERCMGTDKVLEDVLKNIETAFKIAGYTLIYKKVEIENAEIAKEYRFISSPTIRVNGKDICESVEENNCSSCGDIARTQVNCRTYSYGGKVYEVPPKEMIAEAILKIAFEPQVSCYCQEEYVLPENLKNFFEGKETKKCKNTCSSGCC